MLKMRVTLCLIYLTLHLAQAVAGHNDGNCNIEGITDDDWINGYFYRQIIKDIYYNFQVAFKSNTDIGVIAVANDDYLTATIYPNSTTVLITPNNNFHRLDQRTPTTEKDLTIISQEFVFDCRDGLSTLTFLLTVQDSNNNDPIFNYENYYFLMPPRKQYEVDEDITQYFGADIIVTDIDFSNRDVVFTVIPEGAPVTVETEYYLGNKRYRVVVKVQNVNFTIPAEYSIVAYDRPLKPGEPIRNRTVPLSFVKDGGIKLKLDSVLLLLVLTLTWLYNFQ